MGKKIMFIFMCIIFLSGCSNLKDVESKQTNDIVNLEKYNLTISDLDTDAGKIELRTGPLDYSDDIYNGFAVKYKDIIKLYNWQSVTNPAYSPTIYYEDINNDNIKEIIITTISGYGTGYNLSEIHVLKNDDLSEYKIENIDNYIKNNITTKIDNTLTINIKGNVQEINLADYINMSDYTNGTQLYKEALWGNVISYKVENSKILAIAGMQISDTEFLGALVFEFEFIDNSFVISNVYYSIDKNNGAY